MVGKMALEDFEAFDNKWFEMRVNNIIGVGILGQLCNYSNNKLTD